MPQCAVATCRNSHRRTRGRRIRYHRFPQIPEVRLRWVRACGRPPLANGDIPFNIQTARICSLHFTNDSYEKDMEHLVLGLPVRSRLRRGAVPTIGVPVNVQPVTKMLVEDAKRSILKVAHAKIISGERKLMDIANEEKRFYKKCEDEEMDDMYQYKNTFRHNDEHKMGGIDVLLALGLKPASRLNKVQQMDSATTSLTNNNGTNLVTEKVDDTQTKDSSTIPQSRQNGNTFSDETAMPTEQTSITLSNIKKEIIMTDDDEETSGVVKKKRTINDSRKRQTTEDTTNRNSKRIRYEQRERYIDSLVGCDRITTAEELECRAEELVAEVKALDELARAKEMEWNEILSMRKLKEEAYLRLERRRQIMGFLEGNNGQRSDNLPAASLTLASECEGNQHNQSSFYQECQDMKDATGVFHGERSIFKTRSELKDNANQRKDIAKEQSREESQNSNDKYTKNATDLLNENRRMSEDTRRCTRIRSALESETSTRRTPTTTTSSLSSSTPLSAINLELNADGRHIGEGRQGPIVDVRSIIADHRLRNPENVPRRGRRMRNSVNIGLGAGGAMVETGHGDSRPSSTDSCKSNPTNSEAVSFKDVLVQFAKLSQQQGEPVKTPQNYPDVTLHPVAPSPVSINPVVNSGPSGSLLHGILTKNQNTGPTTFSPTLARLLTAPEKERGNTTTAGAGGGSNNNNSSSSNSSSSSSSSASSNNSCVSATLSGGPVGQMQVSQNLLPSYQSSNPVSITDLLSSSKTRTEITITPVNSATQPSINSNSILHSDHVDEEHLLSDGRDSRRSRSNIRDHREDRDAPPRCQGCNDRAAQFVCAGCGNQWYCSRECQVSAWDEHSEVCSG